ncbi:MAG: DNRLRE domain-containing protein [Chloroflexota bacterium]|jgi:hypothetical protein
MNTQSTNVSKKLSANLRQALVLLLLPLLAMALSTTAAQEDGPDGSEAEARIVERIVMPDAVQTTIQFYPTHDAFVSSAFPNSNFGTSPYTDLRVGYDPLTYQAERSLIKFNISSIPTGAQIQNAELQLYQNSATPIPDPHFGGLFSIEARYLAADWNESTITWNSSNPIWGDAIGVGELTVNLGVKTADATEIVRAWYSGARPNYGVQLQGDESPDRGRQRNFDAKEKSGYRPRLLVTYIIYSDTCPPTTNLNSLPAWSPASFNVSWSGTDCGSGGNPPSGIANYDVQYSTDGWNWNNWKTGTKNTSGTFNGSNGVTYWFRARATDNSGNVGAWSGSKSTRVDSVAPTAAINLPGIGGNDGYNFPSFMVFWSGSDALSGLQSYEGQLRLAEGSWETRTFPPTQASTWVTGLTVGKTYELRIRSFDNAGNASAWSSTTTFIVNDPSSYVVSFDPAIVTNGTVTVSWLGFSGSVISNYEVRYRVQGDSIWQTMGNYPGTQSSAPFDASTKITGWPNIPATRVEFEVAATAQNQVPEPFRGVAEADVIFDPQETIGVATFLPITPVN